MHEFIYFVNIFIDVLLLSLNRLTVRGVEWRIVRPSGRSDQERGVWAQETRLLRWWASPIGCPTAYLLLNAQQVSDGNSLHSITDSTLFSVMEHIASSSLFLFVCFNPAAQTTNIRYSSNWKLMRRKWWHWRQRLMSALDLTTSQLKRRQREFLNDGYNKMIRCSCTSKCWPRACQMVQPTAASVLSTVKCLPTTCGAVPFPSSISNGT